MKIIHRWINHFAQAWYIFVLLFSVFAVIICLVNSLIFSTSKKLISRPVSRSTESQPAPFVDGLVSHGSRKTKKIALTFDADMTPYMKKELAEGQVSSWYNKPIVDYLIKERVPATIFMAGMWTEVYPEIARSLAQNQLFEIANHSYSHPRFTPACFALPAVPAWGKIGEFKKSQEAILKNTGITPRYFRFPGGCATKEDIAMANQYGLMTIGWDVASGDSFNTNTAAIIHTVETQTKNGSIVLFHFHGNKNAPKTAEVIPVIIPYLRSKGFEFVKLSELLASQ